MTSDDYDPFAGLVYEDDGSVKPPDPIENAPALPDPGPDAYAIFRRREPDGKFAIYVPWGRKVEKGQLVEVKYRNGRIRKKRLGKALPDYAHGSWGTAWEIDDAPIYGPRCRFHRQAMKRLERDDGRVSYVCQDWTCSERLTEKQALDLLASQRRRRNRR